MVMGAADVAETMKRDPYLMTMYFKSHETQALRWHVKDHILLGEL